MTTRASHSTKPWHSILRNHTASASSSVCRLNPTVIASPPKLRRAAIKRPFWIFICVSILSGPACAEVVVNGSGGGTISWGNRQAVSLMQTAIYRQEAIRLEGHYFSAGAMLLYAVEHIPGSCVSEEATFTFHEPQSLAAALISCSPLRGEARMSAARQYALNFTPALRAWFMRQIMGETADCRLTHLEGRDLASLGYEICAD